MILADKILNLRRKNGWSQEELAEKLNVSRQSISKWEGALSIPDISKIIELAAIFGVTTDFLLKDEIEIAEYTEKDESDKRVRVSVADANEFIKRSTIQGRQTAIGAMLCILSPILLIILSGYADNGRYAISDVVAAVIGITVLLSLVSIAVAAFIISGYGMRNYKHFYEGDFVLEYGVSGIINEKFGGFERRYVNSVIAGIVMCILSVIPLITVALILNNDLCTIYMVGVMLTIISCAVYIFISFGMIKGAYDCILGRGDYEIRKIKENKKNEKLAGFYWPLVTAVYLVWSFVSGNWGVTWLVWPVAGLVFAGISAIVGGDNIDD